MNENIGNTPNDKPTTSPDLRKNPVADYINDFLECGYKPNEQAEPIKVPPMVYLVSLISGLAAAAFIYAIYAAFEYFTEPNPNFVPDKAPVIVFMIATFALLCISTFNFYKKVLQRGQKWMWQSLYRQLIAGIVVALIIYAIAMLVLHQYLGLFLGSVVLGVLLGITARAVKKLNPPA